MIYANSHLLNNLLLCKNEIKNIHIPYKNLVHTPNLK